MFGMGHAPITVKNRDGEEFLICSIHGCGHPREKSPLEFGRFGNIFAFDFLLGFWQKDLELLRDFVFSLDNPGQHIEFGQSPTAPLHLDRLEEALERGEVLVYAQGDPDEAALKAVREQIRLTLSQILIQERAQAARLQAVHKHRTALEKAGALFIAGAEGLGEAGLSFLTWARDVYQVLSIHQRQYRMVVAAWETYNTASDDDWVETFQRKLVAADHKELVEALGFDPWKIDRAVLASAYATVNLVWEDEETRDMVVAFARDYVRAQHSLEWAKIAGGGAFEIVLTAVLVAVTGGIGAAAMLAGKARLLVLLKRLGELFEELAKLRGKVKLRRDQEKGVASRESRLEDYVTDEKVPRPEPPPKGNTDDDRGDREDREDHGEDEEKSTGTTEGGDIVPDSPLSPGSPFLHRVDPYFPGRPDPKYSVDTSKFETWATTSSKGFPRNGKAFWDEWSKMNPDTLSDTNKALIKGLDPRTGERLFKVNKKGKKVYYDHIAPKVDDVWIKNFPEHKDFKWQKIEHHHVDEGRWAVPLPWDLHRGKGNYNTWHTFD